MKNVIKNQKGGKTNIAKKRIDLSEEAVRKWFDVKSILRSLMTRK